MRHIRRSSITMTLQALWLLALVVFLVSAASANSVKQKRPEGMRLITQARALSEGFSAEEQADLLLDILDTPAGRSPENGKKWSLELFSISKRQLKPGPYRAAIQQNALIDLTKVDPSEAARLFKAQDTPDMWDQPGRVEDFRTWVARDLFPKLWAQSGMASLRKIKEFADWLGSTGEYPFVAMISIVQGSAKFDHSVAEGLVSDAVSFYLTNPPFGNKHKEYTAFLLGVANVSSPPLLSKAIEAELDALERESKNPDPHQMRFMTQVTSPQGTVQFSQQAEYIVYQLLPLIDRLDPDWAKEVRRKYQVLQYLPTRSPDAGIGRATGVAILPNTSPSSSEVAAAMDDNRIFQVTKLAESDPAQAGEIATSIQDPGRKAIAQATLIPAYGKVDSRKAANWEEEAVHELDRLPPGKVKLRLLSALAVS